jgi:hypothetical protein
VPSHYKTYSIAITVVENRPRPARPTAHAHQARPSERASTVPTISIATNMTSNNAPVAEVILHHGQRVQTPKQLVAAAPSQVAVDNDGWHPEDAGRDGARRRHTQGCLDLG